MKISLNTYCKECSEKARRKGKKHYYIEPVAFVELNEHGLYKLICPNGHLKWYFISEQLFQILYDLGVLSLSDGYTREAVSSFSTALERFYEFIIKLLLLKKNTDDKVISQYLRFVNRQSERQLGAATALYVSEFKESLLVLDNKWVKFRNEVIHSGIIPNEKKTLDFGQTVVDIIFNILLNIKKKYKTRTQTLLNKVTNYNYQLVVDKNQITERIDLLSMPRIIQLRYISEEYFEKINLSNEIIRYKTYSNNKRISYYQ